ncbi:TonB family protein [Pelagicoccus enzymogenes]|uniref:TonB family protein n=1 Tax=Pelagicoccus enzymogenes TaxID=2773457 RepID=UPI00280E7C81|nr:TonB family protein [Pelagicoccus enzymogenes]MDQ8200161.1 TonB family protein [Pelagicoccus enzymogenes]
MPFLPFDLRGRVSGLCSGMLNTRWSERTRNVPTPASLILIFLLQGCAKTPSPSHDELGDSASSEAIPAVSRENLDTVNSENAKDGESGNESGMSDGVNTAEAEKEVELTGEAEPGTRSRGEKASTGRKEGDFERGEALKEVPIVSEEKKRAFLDYLAKVENIPLDLDRLEQSVRQKYGLLGVADPESVLSELIKLHEAGDQTVTYDLALYLSYGHASIVDHDAAHQLFLQAVSQGDVRGFSALGSLYLNGIGVEQDSVEAQTYYELALAEGDYEAGYLLGMGMQEGRFGAVDLEESSRYFAAAAEAGSQAAVRTLFAQVTNKMGKVTPAQYLEYMTSVPEMENWLLRGVEEGQIEDIIALSKHYRLSDRLEEASAILKKGIELGSYDSAEQLLQLNFPRIFKESDTRAGFEKMFQSFAEDGSRRSGEASFYLALLEISKGAQGADLDRAVKLLEKSRESFHPKSKLALLGIQSGVHPAKAILEAIKLDNKEAYAAANVLAADLGETKGSKVGALDRPPTVLRIPKPEYPYEIMREAIDGTVVVELVVDDKGQVHRPKVVESSHEIFEQEALETALRIEFRPAVKGGKSVAAKVRIPFHFKPSEDALVPAGKAE